MTLAQDLQAVREALPRPIQAGDSFWTSGAEQAFAALARIESQVARLERIEEAAKWYIDCLEGVQARKVVRGLDEAKHGYEAALAAEEGGDRR